MKDIAIFGVGGFGREVLTLISDINKVEPTWNVIGFFDDGYDVGYECHGLKVLGGTEALSKWKKPLNLVIAIGTPKIKKAILKKIDNNIVINYPTLVHPTAIIGDINYVKFGRGCIICAYTIITCDIEVGDFVIFNLACTLGHDTVVKDYCSFMPSCNISGECLIEEGVYCGTGVKIINRTSIGKDTIVGAGAVVVKPLPAMCTAVGSPAKAIKHHD